MFHLVYIWVTIFLGFSKPDEIILLIIIFKFLFTECKYINYKQSYGCSKFLRSRENITPARARIAAVYQRGNAEEYILVNVVNGTIYTNCTAAMHFFQDGAKIGERIPTLTPNPWPHF